MAMPRSEELVQRRDLARPSTIARRFACRSAKKRLWREHDDRIGSQATKIVTARSSSDTPAITTRFAPIPPMASASASLTATASPPTRGSPRRYHERNGSRRNNCLTR